MLWFQDAPDISELNRAAQEDLPSLKQRIIDYFDDLVHAWHPNPFQEPAKYHPCRRKYCDIPENEEHRDFAELLNKVQLHTCRKSYCLKRIKGKESANRTCRFGFPKTCQDVSTLTKVGKGENWEFTPRRNHSRLNCFNPFVMKSWRANMDWTAIVDVKAVLSYIAKYASKGEPRSMSYQQMLMEVLNSGKIKESDTVASLVRRLLMRNIVERDYTAQEVAHILFGFSMKVSSRTFVVLSLNDNSWINIRESANKKWTRGRSAVEKYAEDRPKAYDDYSLIRFTSECYIVGKGRTLRVVHRRKSAVVRVFPIVSPDDGDRFYRQESLLNHPWRSEVEILRKFKSWQAAYNAIKSPKDALKVTDALVKATEENVFEDSSEDELEEMADWQYVSALGPQTNTEFKTDLGTRAVDIDYWLNHTSAFDVDLVRTFVYAQSSTRKIDNFRSVVLNTDQQTVMNILEAQLEGAPDCPQFILVQGVAGAGKSTLIFEMEKQIAKCSRNLIKAAPTGVSANNIAGATIHSVFHLPLNMTECQPLNALKLKEFQKLFATRPFVILDEYSMIGCKQLGNIDRRCREALPDSSDQLFAGLFFYIFGDGNQLQPIGDYALLSKGDKYTKNALMGYAAFQSLDTAIFLDKSMRQAGIEQQLFRDILTRLSKGKLTLGDWEILGKRRLAALPPEERQVFENAMHIFPIRKLASKHNDDMQRKIGLPVLLIQAQNNCSLASKSSSDQAQGLQNELRLNIGARVMLRLNLNTPTGLTNGAMGDVVDIVFSHQRDKIPVAVMVKFDAYSGTTIGGAVPIRPVTRKWNIGEEQCSRTQFPLSLAWAITIHKCQGW